MADISPQNLEGMKKLEKLLEKAAGPDGELPSWGQIMDMLEGLDVSDEVKTYLKKLLKSGSPQVPDGSHLGIVLAVILLIAFLFFGWKLYKSIKEKEIKREEKKKQKQMKKKK